MFATSQELSLDIKTHKHLNKDHAVHTVIESKEKWKTERSYVV